MSENSSKYESIIRALQAKLDEERRKNSRLEAKLAVCGDVESLRSEYELKLKEKDIELKKKETIIGKKDETIKKKDEKIASQTVYIEWLKRKVFGGRTSEKSGDIPGQLKLDFGEAQPSEDEEAAYTKAKEEVEEYYVKRKQAAAKRNEKPAHGRNELPESLRREVEDVFPEGYNEEEWELMPEAFDEVTEILEHTPEEFFVRRIVKHKAVRKGDADRTIYAAKTPALPIAKSYASASLLAHIMTGKYYDHLPYYRQIDMYRRVGVNIPATTINGWFLDVADLLRPLYYRIKDLVLASDYIQADETTVPVMKDEKHRTVKGYLWQVRAIMQNLAFFHYDKGSRSKDVALSLFAYFQGAMQVDGYPVYDMYENKSGVLTLVCWAHARRYFTRAMSNDKARAEYALHIIGLLYEIERKADDDNLCYEEREELRANLALPILYGFEKWLKDEKPKVMPKSPIGKAINFALERYDRLCRYCADGRYRIDNNLVENGQRKVALGRKNYLFCGNDDAAEDAAVIYTMMECCRMVGADFEKWLTYVLDHIHEYDDYSKPLDELLPSVIHSRRIC